MAPPASTALSLGSRASVLWPAESSDPPASLKDKDRELRSRPAYFWSASPPRSSTPPPSSSPRTPRECGWTLDGTAEALTLDFAASKEEVAALTNHLAASKALEEEENGTLAQEVESLSRLLAEGAGGKELASGAGGGSEGGKKRRKASVTRGVEEGGRGRRRGEARVEADESRINHLF